jgi:uncharacterized protein YfiM (DUF2279 family)
MARAVLLFGPRFRDNDRLFDSEMKTAANVGILSGMAQSLRRVALAVLFLLAASRAAAEGFRLFHSTVPASSYFFPPPEDGAPRFHLAALMRWLPWSGGEEEHLRIAVEFATEGTPDTYLLPLLPPRKSGPFLNTPTMLTTSVTLVGAGIFGLTAGWAHGFHSFHFGNEQWFGRNTYAGGSDKASHFIVCATLGRELAWAYDHEGHERAESTAMAFGVATLSGLLVEIVDGFTPYGFAWEDFTADALGAATGVILTRAGLNDLLGLRLGKVPTGFDDSGLEGRATLGTVYVTEIYSADLKIAGLARRMRFDPGPARFLMTSVTYNTKGFGYEPPVPERQRLVGFELGLNVPEILSAAGVPETTWWGIFLYKALNFFRIPFTSFGFRYDLDRKTWHGPDTGEKFYPN